MSPNLILQLVEIAIGLAQSQLDSGTAADTLLGITQKAVQAYKNHTGETLDPALIKPEGPI